MIALHCGLGEYNLSLPKNRKLRKFLKNVSLEMIKSIKEGNDSVDVVCKCIAMLEDIKYTNAGVGSALTKSASVEMEAGVMEGFSGLFGGVSCIQHIKNPVYLAKTVLNCQKTSRMNKLVMPQYLSGKGAEDFAHLHNIEFCENSSLITESIGHVSLPCGSGIWVNQKRGTSVCTTGVGELIAREIIARKACDIVTNSVENDFITLLGETLTSIIKDGNPGDWPPLFAGLIVKISDNGTKSVACFLTGMKLLVAFATLDSPISIKMVDGPEFSDSKFAIQQ
ncbi:hypothetical protein MXB_2154, partial [Myxobolus squamalis]